jgi:hypothetical protein
MRVHALLPCTLYTPCARGACLPILEIRDGSETKHFLKYARTFVWHHTAGQGIQARLASLHRYLGRAEALGVLRVRLIPEHRMKVGFKKSNKGKRKAAKRAAAASKATLDQAEPRNMESGMGMLPLRIGINSVVVTHALSWVHLNWTGTVAKERWHHELNSGARCVLQKIFCSMCTTLSSQETLVQLFWLPHATSMPLWALPNAGSLQRA